MSIELRQAGRIFALAVAALMMQSLSAATVDELQRGYQARGATSFSAESGADMWQRKVVPQLGAQPRSCASCHGSELTAGGKHVRTGKSIQPLAPSANPKRLTDMKKVEKWFRRNCKWTWGRECSAQEKGDFLEFIKRQ